MESVELFEHRLKHVLVVEQREKEGKEQTWPGVFERIWWECKQ